MINKINNINFLNYKSVFVLGCTEDTATMLEKLFEFKIRKLTFKKEITDIEELASHDLIIIDIDYFIFEELNIIFFRHGLNIPILCITSKLDDNTSALTKNNSVKNILLKESQLEYIYTYTILALNERKKVQLGFKHIYCLEQEKLFYKLQEIKLTRLESKLLKLLILNKNNILSYKEIESEVWGLKKCSIYSMRNIVNKIREKSFDSIIKNISGKGYLFNNNELY
jgi:DNA-binding response OmpR family regulator